MQPKRFGMRGPRCASMALLSALILPCVCLSQEIFETSQQTNDRIRARSMVMTKIGSHDYVIGPGDLLTIQVFDIPELSGELRVSQTGSIAMPLVPVRLQVSGLTEAQTQQKIKEVLEANGLVSHPEVMVSVKERRSKPITIVGAVVHPMIYQADGPVALIEVLAEAGGITNDAGDTVIVTRASAAKADDDVDALLVKDEEIVSEPPVQSQNKQAATGNTTPEIGEKAQGSATGASGEPANQPSVSGNIITVNLNDLLEAGNSQHNIELQSGDIVTVPHAGIVYVLGAVSRPGGFVVSNDRSQLTTLKVLALAGGMTRTAKTTQAVVIRKDNQGHQHEVSVDLRKVIRREAEDLQLQPSDILYVPENAGKQALLRAAEVGIAVGSAIAIFRVANHY